MERHSEAGEALLRRIEEFSAIASVVRHHHERIDGAGYPDALRGEDIPYIARVIAVADSYNAMTSDRPYRAAMSPGSAYRRLLEGRATQFDPAIVDAFAVVLKQATMPYRKGLFGPVPKQEVKMPLVSRQSHALTRRLLVRAAA